MARFAGLPPRGREKAIAAARHEVTARPTVAQRLKNKINKERRAARKRAEDRRRSMAARYPAPAAT